VLTKNTGTIPQFGTQTPMLQIAAADTVQTTVVLQSFNTGNTAQPTIFYGKPQGTAASPTANTVGNFIGANFAYGYATTSSAGFQTGGGAGFVFNVTDATCTTTTCGMRTDMFATPTGTNTVQVSMSIGAGAMIGTTTDPGTGGLTATGASINFTALANVATTSALCYNTGTGRITFDGTLGTCTVSDERLKNVVSPITGALDKLLKINGFYYTWKDSSLGSGLQIGVGAQTVERVFPELVQTDSSGRKSADYQRLTAPIIEAIRELKYDNDNLQLRIQDLERERRIR
jgi:Chaperone of endosialidase